MSIPKGVRELRIEFERITSKRGNVAELRAAFDCINSKCETKAADERRTNNASPRMLSSPFDVREKSGSATPEQWQSPRQYWGAAVNNLAQHTFPSDGWYGRASQHKVVSPRMLSSPFYVREACESTTFAQWPLPQQYWGPAVNNLAQHTFPPDSRHSRTPQYKAKNSGGGSNSIPNPAKTEANRWKKFKKGRNAQIAGVMNRQEQRAHKRKTDTVNALS